MKNWRIHGRWLRDRLNQMNLKKSHSCWGSARNSWENLKILGRCGMKFWTRFKWKIKSWRGSSHRWELRRRSGGSARLSERRKKKIHIRSDTARIPSAGHRAALHQSSRMISRTTGTVLASSGARPNESETQTNTASLKTLTRTCTLISRSHRSTRCPKSKSTATGRSNPWRLLGRKTQMKCCSLIKDGDYTINS